VLALGKGEGIRRSTADRAADTSPKPVPVGTVKSAPAPKVKVLATGAMLSNTGLPCPRGDTRINIVAKTVRPRDLLIIADSSLS
jgi:hypothetical protein